MSARGKVFKARHAMGSAVSGQALVARDGFSARYDLDRLAGVFSRSTHKLAGQSYVGRILVLDTAKGGTRSACPGRGAGGHHDAQRLRRGRDGCHSAGGEGRDRSAAQDASRTVNAGLAGTHLDAQKRLWRQL